MRVLLFLFLLGSIFNTILAQEGSITISGQVSGTKGESLPFANILLDSTTGTIADEEGFYSITTNPGNHHLRFSYVGFHSEEKIVFTEEDLILHIQLEPLGMLDQVVITGSKHETRYAESVVSMEVLQPDFIENNNPHSIDDALQKAPGVTIIDGQANIRGGSGYSYGAGSRVLLLMNDLPILSGDAAFPAWNFVPVEMINQVEIIKGASSVLYGSSALNGVINIRTKTATSVPETHVHFFSGIYDKPGDNITDELERVEFDIVGLDTLGVDSLFKEKAWWDGNIPFYTSASLTHLRKVGRVGIAGHVSFFNENSFLQNDYDRRGRAMLNFESSPLNSGKLHLELNTLAQISRNASFFMWAGDGSNRYIPLPNTTTENKNTRIAIDPAITYFDPLNNKHKLLARYFKADNITPTGQSTLSDMYYGEYRFQREFKALQLMLTAGATGSYTEVEAELYGDTSHTAMNGAGFLQLDKEFGERVRFSAGMRYESNQINEEEVDVRPVFRVGTNVNPAKATFIRASFGQGYRYPTIAEKFIRTGVGLIQIYPNPDLIAETGWSAEVGVKQGIRIGSWEGFADVAAFIMRYSDMMEFSFGGVDGTLPGFQSVNVGDTEIKGIEVTVAGEGKISVVDLRLIGGYTYIDPRFAVFDSIKEFYSSADYNVLKYRFRHAASLDLEAGFKKWSIGFGGRYLSRMEAIDRVFEVFIPGVKTYREENTTGAFIADFSIHYKVQSNSRLSLHVRNLFNNEYSMRPAMMEAPRHFALSYTMSVFASGDVK